MRISDWSSDVCSSDLTNGQKRAGASHRLLLAKTAEICFKFGHIECFPESRSPPMAETDTRQAPARGPGPATGNGRHRWRFFRAGGFDQVRIESGADLWALAGLDGRSEEHTSELQSLMRISYAVFCLKKKNKNPQ